ncbi:hypothetical protein SteCoe_25583 [Stentor coeruleus]|uniref:Calmodulin n=1 Tax=Stentor coeruleus TaxID=5963 RepID=A0A1R2BEU9_9CILI|nr:hypothetical protein SteCoe_25583 [Stentor coeruleus]
MVEHLSEEQIKEFKEVFSLFENENSRTITTKQLGTVIRSLGLNPTEGEIQEIIKKVDVDDNGTIDFSEFLNIMSRMIDDKDIEQELLEAFNAFDKDGDGLIDIADIRHSMKILGEKLSSGKFYEDAYEIDCDVDGKINFEEFLKMLIYK